MSVHKTRIFFGPIRVRPAAQIIAPLMVVYSEVAPYTGVGRLKI